MNGIANIGDADAITKYSSNCIINIRDTSLDDCIVITLLLNGNANIGEAISYIYIYKQSQLNSTVNNRIGIPVRGISPCVGVCNSW